MFETLSRHPDLYTIGGESHALIEHIPALSTVARGYVSNRLDKNDASQEIIETLHSRFIDAAQNASGRRVNRQMKTFRLLEKTPKNALRIEFLKAVFPDAKYIFLVRDPRENISSIMQAWRSKRFVTYPNLPDWQGDWSLFLPDNWKTLIGEPLASVATFQYRAANQAIIEGLEQIPDNRKMLLNYHALVNEPKLSIEAILSFAGLTQAPVNSILKNGLALSRFTVTKPVANKWYANASQMAPYISNVKAQVKLINQWLMGNKQAPIIDNIDMTTIAAVPNNRPLSENSARVSRNALCPCGSGKKYRKCHGQLT